MPGYFSEEQDDGPHARKPAASITNGGMAGMLAALTVLVLVAVAAFWLIGTQKPAGSAIAAHGTAQAGTAGRQERNAAEK